MSAWIYGIVAAGFVMTFVLRILPENSVKRAVSLAFGIIFLLVTAAPIGKLFINNSASFNLSEYFEANLSGLDEEDSQDYIDEVISTYCASTENAVEEQIYEKTGYACDVVLSVNSDVKSDSFGNIISVSCRVVSLEKKNSDVPYDENSIITSIPLIEDIVISIGGNEGENEQNFNTDDILAVISEMLGVTAEMCTFTI